MATFRYSDPMFKARAWKAPRSHKTFTPARSLTRDLAYFEEHMNRANGQVRVYSRAVSDATANVSLREREQRNAVACADHESARWEDKQLRNARATLKSATAALEQARKDSAWLTGMVENLTGYLNGSADYVQLTLTNDYAAAAA